jgi:hypothetical protein
LRRCQLCSHSKTSQHFMEPEVSLPYSQKPSTGPYPEPDRSSPYHPILSKIYLILSTYLRLGFRYLFPHYVQRSKYKISYLRSFIQVICAGLRRLMNFRNKLIFYGELLAPHPTPKLENHPLSAVRDCLFNIFAATLHIWSPVFSIRNLRMR